MMKKVLALAAVLMLVTLSFGAALSHTANDSTENTSVFTPTENESSDEPSNETNETGNDTGDNLSVGPSITLGDNATDENVTDENETEDNLTEEEEALETNITAEVSTVLLASTENYPDAILAGVASDRAGAPVLLTDRDELPNETQQVLETLNPDNVVVVGGTSVISSNVTDGLESEYNVTRLWGVTQYGTAVEVAEYFWPEGADHAVIAQDEREERDFRTAAIAAGLAKQEDAPLYLTPERGIPAIVLASLNNLEVEQSTLIGTNVTNDTSTALNALGISVNEIAANNTSQLRDEVDATTRDQLSEAEHAVLTAGTNFSTAITAPGAPNTAVLHVENTSEIETTVELLLDEDVETVTVIGEAGLGQQLADELTAENIAVTRILGSEEDVVRLNAEFVLEHAQRFERAHEFWLQERENIAEENEDYLQERAGLLIVQVEGLIGNNASDEAEESLEHAAGLFQDNDYISSIQESIRARNIVRLDRFELIDDQALAAEIEAELQTVEQFRVQVREQSEQFADVFEEAPVDDQLWVVEAVRTVPPEEEQRIFDETASTLEVNESIVPQFEEARDRVAEGNLTTNQTGNETVGNETDLNITDNATTNETNVTNDTEGNETNLSTNETVNVTGNETTNETTNATENATGTGTNESINETMNVTVATVNYSSDGFEPETVEIEQGDTLRWNSEGPELWVASAVHPTHAEYDNTSRTEHCDNGSSSTFDQCSTEESYNFTFNRTGEWDYHNHVEPSHTGTVVVQ